MTLPPKGKVNGCLIVVARITFTSHAGLRSRYIYTSLMRSGLMKYNNVFLPFFKSLSSQEKVGLRIWFHPWHTLISSLVCSLFFEDKKYKVITKIIKDARHWTPRHVRTLALSVSWAPCSPPEIWLQSYHRSKKAAKTGFKRTVY